MGLSYIGIVNPISNCFPVFFKFFDYTRRAIMANWFKSAYHIGLGVVISTILGSLAHTAQAAEDFNNNFIRFEKDTAVEFEFVESRGAYQSTMGVVNLVTGEKVPLLSEVKASDDQSLTSPRSQDFIGTPGNTVPQPLAEFVFKAGQPYAMYLESNYQGRDAGTIYSSNNRNLNAQLQARVGDMSGLSSQGVKIEWDDTGSVLSRRNDTDFNDFVTIAGGNAGIGCRK
jgi:hypothetical protein